MTLFEDDRYDWRETYFVYFESSHRPKLPEVRRALQTYATFFNILNSKSEANGNLVEMTIASYEDHAALEIIYREGNDILTEAKHLARSLKKGATPEEHAKLQKIIQCRARFDVHHFEQLAGTAVFNVTKLPELKFPKQRTRSALSSIFLKAFKTDTPNEELFHFDPNSYAKCRSPGGDESETTGADSGEFERINPEMLVTVLESLCFLSKGIALDPASGIVI